MSFIDRFLYKLFIGFFLLAIVVILDYFKFVSYENIKEKVSEHFNVLEIIKKINGSTKIIPINYNEDIVVSSDIYPQIKLENNEYFIKLDEYEAVENYCLGIVISIYKNKDDTYKVKILGNDDVLYIYDRLESVNCNIYSCLDTKEIIGKASYNFLEKYNYFYLKPMKNNQFYKLYK